VTHDPHAVLRTKLLETVLDARGESDPSVRRAAFEGRVVPPDLQALIEKIRAHAYKVTDEDLERVRATYGDDALFEIIVATALGASERRLLAGLEALNDA
jgi:predicted RNA polymerase sigma factor